MVDKKPSLVRRAWNLLRLALLWPRKGRSVCHRVARLLSARHHRSDHLHYYREHELSFDDTPTFRFSLCRPHFPCISPNVSFREGNHIEDSNEEEQRLEFEARGGGRGSGGGFELEEADDEEEKEIDTKAEEFIERFHKQMNLQRQASVLNYNEMLQRGSS